jgi:hypothetical protein
VEMDMLHLYISECQIHAAANSKELSNFEESNYTWMTISALMRIKNDMNRSIQIRNTSQHIIKTNNTNVLWHRNTSLSQRYYGKAN